MVPYNQHSGFNSHSCRKLFLRCRIKSKIGSIFRNSFLHNFRISISFEFKHSCDSRFNAFCRFLQTLFANNLRMALFYHQPNERSGNLQYDSTICGRRRSDYDVCNYASAPIISLCKGTYLSVYVTNI